MMQRNQIQSLAFIALLAVMLILMSSIFLPFAGVILWSAFLYILVSPLYTRLIRLLTPGTRFYDVRRQIIAAVFALGTVLLVAGVLVFLGFKLIGQVTGFVNQIKQFVQANPTFFQSSETGVYISDTVRRLSLGAVDISRINLKEEALSLLVTYSNTLVGLTRSLAKNVSGFVLSLAFLCFSLYFFYADGAYLARVFIRAIPIDSKDTKRLLRKFREVTRNLFMGFFLVAFYQAIAGFIIFSIFGINGSLLFAVLILFSSFIPIFGCAIIWIPLGLSVFALQGVVPGVLFMLLCAFFISFLDNFLRPFFLQERVKIHPLLIFFSILGGLQVFGFNGILLGPIVVILFFTTLDILLGEETEVAVKPGELPDDLLDGSPHGADPHKE
ncbi:MAG: AI-2E family transporter [Spirochaetales bacterium]|nr:AI-2E family transporter [Spirochaetales bacterium]